MSRACRKTPEQSTIYRIVNFPDDIHLLPLDDVFAHLTDCNCPCNCYHDPVNQSEEASGLARKSVWVHRRISEMENKH